jgi:MFS transporter, OFA family, oxalate/formate antiporter
MNIQPSATQIDASLSPKRWRQLALALICMLAISSPQYVWTLFTKIYTAQMGVSLPQLQVTFSILIVVQTFFSPLQGILIDKLGTRTLLSMGGALTGLSWVLAAQVDSLMGLYLSYGLLGGLGTGAIYVGVIGLMAQWFPDRRGFATGIAAAGYGMGAMVTTFPISDSLASKGLSTTLTTYGLILGAMAVLAALGLKAPDAATQRQLPRNAHTSTTVSVGPAVMLRQPLFWLMFVMMTLMSTSGLMVISQMGTFTKDFGLANVMVFGLAALPLALTIDRFTNGLTRPFFGWLSDQLGREKTMALAFGLEAIAMLLWLQTRDNALWFVLMSGVVFFGWGEIFSLFPSTLTDTFGEAHSTLNYGFLYIAQGVGSVLGGPIAAALHDATGSWIPVFHVIIACDALTAILALMVLKPMRQKYLART